MKTIRIDRDKYSELLCVTRWYQNFPSNTKFEAGDRFHERVFEFQHENFDYDVEEGLYVNYFEFLNECLYVVIGADNGSIDHERALVVPK